MQAHHRIDCGVVEHSFFDHRQRPGDLFVGLEHEFDRSRDGVSVLRENLGGHQKHGHVGVMATGMHHARVLRLVVNIVFFVDRQGIHIRPQHQHRTGARSLQNGHHSGLGHAPRAQTEFLKIGFNHFGGTILFKAQLGILVEIPPQSDQLLAALVDLFRYLNVHVWLASCYDIGWSFYMKPS